MDLMQYKANEPFTQKHLLTLQDWSEDEIYQCLSLALQLKKMQKSGEKQSCLSGKTLAMIFAKEQCGDSLKIYTLEYYSAIKKNTFESVLMRWMKLEPIIQSQKKKHQYSILRHIYGI